MSGWIEWNHRRAGRVVEKAGHDGHHVSQRSDAKEGIIGARKRIFVGKKGVLPCTHGVLQISVECEV